MKLSRVNEDLREAFKYQFFPPIHWPGILWLAKMLYRLPAQARQNGVNLTVDSIGINPVRIYTPDSGTEGAAIIMFHGGGLIGGSPDMNDWYGSWYAKELKATVISPGYRTAPEDQAPAALDDCWASWNWLLRAATDLNIEKHRIALFGVSAGGGLATCLSQRIRDECGVQPAALVVNYPMLDDRTASNRSLDQIQHILWNNTSNRVGWSAYLGAERVGCRTLPNYLSASRCTDLQGLPPTWIGCGDIDLFFDESREYAQRLQDAGVECEFKVVSGAPHGFEFLAKGTELVGAYRQASLDFLKRHLAQKQPS